MILGIYSSDITSDTKLISSSIRIEGGGKEVTAIDIELGGYL
jgi:hypothetical protein